MVKNEESWKRFEQTGAIKEYLNYTACTSEKTLDSKKERKNDPNGYGNRDCISNNAHR